MKIVKLIHDKKLTYYPKNIGKIDKAIVDAYNNKADYFVSFYDVDGCEPDIIVKGVNACVRFTNKFDGNLAFYNLEETSGLAPVIFWDIAHTLSVGSTITIIGRCDWYKREYYSESLKVVEVNQNITVFRKEKELLVEAEAGLDEWTFGIPVGPGDATVLNKVVKRILSFNIEKSEIILCGRPGDNFKYWDKVKIVGEDIPAPPVQICKKKNTIANVAKYKNLCILHDRVYLPADFVDAISKYGDYFAVTGFQSVYFADSLNRRYIRYSDYNIFESDIDFNIGIVNGNGLEYITHEFASMYESNIKKCIYANPVVYYEGAYMTGSLYIIKKKLWNKYPQKEELLWEDYEDVEYGKRLSKIGVISCINPYSFTQSILHRKTIIGYGNNHYEEVNHSHSETFNFVKIFSGRNKPCFNITVDEYKEKVYNFCKKYNVNKNDIIIFNNMSNKDRWRIILKCIMESKFLLTPNSVSKFLKDFQHDILLWNFSKVGNEFWINLFMSVGNKAKFDFLEWKDFKFDYMLYKGNIFRKKYSEYFPNKSLLLKLTSLMTAVEMNMKNGRLLYSPYGIKGFYKNIINSTPFMEDGDE